jgi:hypothetical protein
MWTHYSDYADVGVVRTGPAAVVWGSLVIGLGYGEEKGTANPWRIAGWGKTKSRAWLMRTGAN